MNAVRRSSERTRKLFFSVLWVAVAGPAFAQDTWYVDGACGDNTWSGLGPVCRAPDGPKKTIQAGMNAASTGDTVIVKDGVYTGPGNKGLFFPSSQNFTLRSENGPQACTIDMQNVGRAFSFASAETSQATVQGFTIANGNTSSGGGIWFHHQSRLNVIDCIFVNNAGSAVHIETDACPTIVGCRFIGNSTLGSGGAIAFVGMSPTPSKIINCLIVGNTAAQTGGGIYGAAFGLPPSIINCTITGNTAATSGGGIYVGPSRNLSVVNSIVWGNTGDEIVNNGNLQVTFSDVDGGWPGLGNVSADPLLDPLADFQLRAGSPCVDSGNNAAVPVGITIDLAGLPRILDGDMHAPKIVDMGAHEFHPMLSPERK